MLTLILLTWEIWWVPNARKQQMGFNSAFRVLSPYNVNNRSRLPTLHLETYRSSYGFGGLVDWIAGPSEPYTEERQNHVNDSTTVGVSLPSRSTLSITWVYQLTIQNSHLDLHLREVRMVHQTFITCEFPVDTQKLEGRDFCWREAGLSNLQNLNFGA
jgi:hypothetical protein